MGQCKAKSKRSRNRCKNNTSKHQTVCHMHGGKTPVGIASPTYKTGRYSAYIPNNIASNYSEALKDKDPLSLTDDVILLRSFTTKDLERMKQGDTHPAWIEAHTTVKVLSKAIKLGGDPKTIIEALTNLEEIIKPHYRATKAQQRVTGYIDQLGRVADKERRLLIDRQKVITVEQALALLTAVVMGIRESVLKYCERKIATRILTEANTIYSTAIGSGPGNEAIDSE